MSFTEVIRGLYEAVPVEPADPARLDRLLFWTDAQLKR